MINKLLQIIAPHHCYGCSTTGTVLCANCKYDIVDEPYDGCVVCESPAVSGICELCMTSYQKAWCVGSRDGALENLLNGIKFDGNRDVAAMLARMLDTVLPVLPANTEIVPVPTLPRHVRQRGFDHTLTMARQLATIRGLRATQALGRRDAFQQRGQDKKRRFEQASGSFQARRPVRSNIPYLLVDDIITTNATVRYAAQTLKDAGATDVWVAVIARQPLEK